MALWRKRSTHCLDKRSAKETVLQSLEGHPQRHLAPRQRARPLQSCLSHLCSPIGSPVYTPSGPATQNQAQLWAAAGEKGEKEAETLRDGGRKRQRQNSREAERKETGKRTRRQTEDRVIQEREIEKDRKRARQMARRERHVLKGGERDHKKIAREGSEILRCR